MKSWLEFFKSGLSRSSPADGILDQRDAIGWRTGYHLLQPFIQNHWKKALIGGFFLLLSTLLGFAVPLIFRFLVDRVILGEALNLLISTVMVFAAVQMVALGASALQSFYFTRFELEVILDLQQFLLDRTLKLPKSFFDDKQTGYLMSRLTTDVGGLRLLFSSLLVHVVISLIRLVGGIVLLIYLKWQLAVVVLIILPLIFSLVRFFSRKFKILSHHNMETQAQVSSALQESLSTSTLVKSFSTEDSTVKKYTDKLRAAFQIGLEQGTVGSASELVISFPPEFARLIVLGVGAYLVITGNWTLGSLLAFRSYVGFVYSPARFLASTGIRFQSAFAALERISVIANLVPEENLETGKKVTNLKGIVEFRDVSFSYNDRDWIIQNVSFTANPGEKIAIVGPSGVGKTTLISLIFNFYKPSRGDIFFDGEPISAFNLRSLRQRIGYVAQEPVLISGTIMENLRYGCPDAKDEDIRRVSQTVGIDDFIQQLPRGYQTVVGKEGLTLSAGQTQRLTLVRALVKDPDILILDEPTSALDKRSERSILDGIEKAVRDKTLFLVSHRVSTVKKAKRVLVFDENRLIASGTHRDLLENNPFYASLIVD